MCDCGSDRAESARHGHPHLSWCAAPRTELENRLQILAQQLTTERDELRRQLTTSGLVRLTASQEKAAKDWAADDRLWTTQETVEINLRTFARVILLCQREAR